MIWRVLFTPKAERDLKRLSISEEQRIKDELTALAAEPYPRTHVKKTEGTPKHSDLLSSDRAVSDYTHN